MKRSEINRSILRAMELLEGNKLKLPAFAYWKLPEWRERKEKLENLRKLMLGWDVTDFGSGAFEQTGAVLFTIRNGSPEDSKLGTPYAEKLIFLHHETEQQIPFHFHRVKTEDIINRSDGVLMLELYNSTLDGGLDYEREICVKMDGVTHTFAPGVVVEVEKGASITLEPGLHHRFWAKKGAGDLIAGEVSSVNDDRTDNVFLNPGNRFASVEEDEPVLIPLCNEYHILDR